MKFLRLLFLLLLPVAAIAQNENDVWAFGYNVGIDFSSGTAVAINPSMETNEGVCAISDADGNLMFYSNGDNIWNADFDEMPSGSSLISTEPSSSSQASVIVPMPGNADRYYVFSLEIVEFSTATAPGRLYYSVVDMTLDGGLGDVVPGLSGILVDSALDEKMITIQGECNNVWLIVHSRQANEYFSYEITEDGISADPIVSVIGDGVMDMSYGKGVIKASHDRTKIAAANNYYNHPTTPFEKGPGMVEYYDFDVVTGSLSGRYILVGEDSDYYESHVFYGVCFSPNDSVLYATSQQGALLQFDFGAGDIDDIIESTIDINDGSFYQYGDLQAAPDGKIYISQPISSFLHTVENPNIVGTGCDYSPSSFALSGTYAYFGLQNLVTPPIARVDTNEIAVHDTVTCAALVLNGREGATSYLWNTGATTETITIPAAGTYWVRSKNGCYSMDTFHVIQDVLPPPIIATEDTTICSHLTAIQLSAEVTNQIGTTYLWTPAPAIVAGATDSVVTVNPTVEERIYIRATNNFGICTASATDSIDVYIFGNDVNIVTRDTTICSGDQIALQAIGPDMYTYHWSPEDGMTAPNSLLTFLTGSVTTDYVLTTTFEHCESTDTLRITVEPTPQVNIGNDTVICDYTQLHLVASTAPATFSGYSYDWHPGVYMDDSTIVDPLFQTYTYSGPLIAIVTTPAGCTGSDTANISVNTSSFMIVNPIDTGICLPGAVQLSALAAESYQWIPAAGLSSDTIGNPIASPETTTEYLVMGTSREGCVDSQYVTITIHPEAAVYLPDSVTIYPGESYQIAPEGNATYYTWFPPSGLTDVNISNPVASPEVRTRYFYNATTENGCTITDSIDIYVSTESLLDVPNAFVPGNGDNNIFKIGKRGIASVKSFHIFNRWGNKVFETTDINKGWDGTYNGTPQPAGVYIYTIDAVTSTGKPFVKQGNVTLIR